MIKVAPSLLAADFLNLGDSVAAVNRYGDIIHLDVMDGVFVPNISFGFPVVRAVSKIAEKPMDVHLMITSPEKYAVEFARIPGVEMVSFHLNATQDPASLLQQLRKEGVKAGLVINPDIPVSSLYPYLEECDYVLLMSVFAGFGGQSLIEDTFDRVAELKKHILEKGLDIEIEVDGGVKSDNAARLIQSGVDIIVAGTGFFMASDPEKFTSELKQS